MGGRLEDIRSGAIFPLIALGAIGNITLAQWGFKSALGRVPRGWAGIAGVSACGASALFLLRDVNVDLPNWLVLAVSYLLGALVTAFLLALLTKQSKRHEE